MTAEELIEENAKLKKENERLREEIEKLQALKVERATALSISSRKGKAYQKYLKDMDFLDYLQRTHEILYKGFRKDWEKYNEIMGGNLW